MPPSSPHCWEQSPWEPQDLRLQGAEGSGSCPWHGRTHGGSSGTGAWSKPPGLLWQRVFVQRYYRGLRPPWGCGCVEAAGGLWALQPRRAGQRGRVSWEGWDRARRCKRRLSCGRSRCQATTGISCGIGVVLPLAGCPQGWAEAGMPKDELVSRGCRWKRRERTALPARLKCGHPLLVWPAKG